MKRRGLSTLLWVASLTFGAASAQPVSVEGVSFEPSVTVADKPLVLNGTGVRTRVVFKVYAAGLYVPQKAADPVALLAQTGPRRVSIGMLRDVDAATFSEALLDGLRANHTDEQFAAFKPQIERLQAAFKSVGAAKKGDRILIDFLPDTGTRISVNGTPHGEPIAGAPFFAALLRIWIGDKPADAALKKGMLGG